jgi:hypothetical protein
MTQKHKHRQPGRWVLLILAAVSVLSGAGCSVEEGIRDGVNNGVSAALSALIQAPMNHALEEAFNEE